MIETVDSLCAGAVESHLDLSAQKCQSSGGHEIYSRKYQINVSIATEHQKKYHMHMHACANIIAL